MRRECSSASHFASAMQVPLTRASSRAGARPIAVARLLCANCCMLESGCLRVQPKAGGKLHLRLNITARPIANKYREGKLQRTLKREFNRT
jgi:hypothetical protein